MTARAEYTDDEWALLSITPWMVAVAVSVAEPGGVVRELVAAVKTMSTARERYPDNELIAALMAGRSDQTMPGAPQGPDVRAEDASADILDRAVSACRDVVELLEVRSHAAEADGVRRLFADIALASARATSNGGVLGIGGVRVTAAERNAVDAIRRALGLDPLPSDPESAPGIGLAGAAPRPDTIRPHGGGSGGSGIPSGPIHPE